MQNVAPAELEATGADVVCIIGSSSEETQLSMQTVDCQQSNAQNPSSQASALCELRASKCISQIQKKQRNERSNCQHLLDHRKSKTITENIYFCFIDYAKAFECVYHNKLENSERDGNTRPPDLPPCKTRMQVKKQQLEPDMEKQIGSNRESSKSRLYIVTLLI